MRLPTVLLATASAVALVCAMSGTAFAAEGKFTYRYLDGDGDVQVGSLVDPPSRECIEIPEIAGGDAEAFRPRNDTGSRAVVFKNSECEGDDYFSLRPNGGHGSDRLKLRSVVFS